MSILQDDIPRNLAASRINTPAASPKSQPYGGGWGVTWPERPADRTTRRKPFFTRHRFTVRSSHVPVYDLTAPAVMPSIKRRCSSTKTNTTGSAMVTAAASISPQSVENCPVRP